MTSEKPRVLVAGLGNIFFSDDGFGVEVVRRLTELELPEGVEVEDVGIRGLHLAIRLLDGIETLILIDALPQKEPPGTISVIEPDLERPLRPGDASTDAHQVDPVSVLNMVRALGGKLGRVLVVGCEPERIVEGVGLSASVMRAAQEAVGIVTGLIEQALRRESFEPV